MPSFSGLFGAASSAAEEVLIAFRAETSDAEKKLSALDAKLAAAEARQKAAFTEAQDQDAKLRAMENDHAVLDQRISAARQELATKRVASSAQEFDALMKVRDGLRQKLAADIESRNALAQLIEKEQAHNATLQAKSMELAKVTAAARAAAEAQAGASKGGIGVGGVALGTFASLAAMQAAMALANAIDKAATSYQKLGHEVQHTSALMGTSTENASQFLYTMDRFGISTENATRTVLQLTRHITDNEKQFSALGIATRDTNGRFLDSYTVFRNLQQVMAGMADGTAKTRLQMELASRGAQAGGMSFQELNQILSLSQDQMAALSREADRNNAIIGEDGARAGTSFVMSQRAMDSALAGLGRSFSQLIAGPLTPFINKVLEAASALNFLARSQGSFFDKVGGFFGVGPLAAGASKAASDAVRDAQIAGAAPAGGRAAAEPGLKGAGGGRAAERAQIDALRDKIEAIREEASERERTLQKALTAFERERTAAIKAIEDERNSRTEAAEAAIAALEKEADARQQMYEKGNQARQDEIAGIRDQISLLERKNQVENAQEQLANDQTTVEKLRATTVYRTKGETLEQYQQKVFDHNQRLKAAEEKLGDDRKKITLDETKFKLEQQIKAIEAVSKSEARRFEDFREGTKKQIDQIRQTLKEDQEASAKKISAIRDEMQKRRDATDAELKSIRDIAEDQTKAIDKQIRSIERAAQASAAAAGTVGAAWVGAFNGIGDKADEAAAKVAALAAQMDAIRNAKALDRDNAPGGDSSGSSGGVFDAPIIGGLLRNSPIGVGSAIGGLVVNYIDKYLGGSKGISAPFSPYAYGGSLTLREPAQLIGSSGTNYGTFGEAGSERVTAGGSSPETIIIPVMLDGAKITEIVSERQGRALARRVGSGYGRKTG